MNSKVKKIQIVCPICNAAKVLPVPQIAKPSNDGNSIVINVPKMIICEHAFRIEFDKNMTITSYIFD